jgi:oxalate decarboxylase
MNERSRRKVLAVGTALGAVTATTALAGTFGNPDQPAQGIETTQKYPRGAVDPGPQNQALSGQFPKAFTPPATDVGGMPQFWSSSNIAPRRIQQGGWARQVTQSDFQIASSISGVNMRLDAGSPPAGPTSPT